jgi:hypothetical protein
VVVVWAKNDINMDESFIGIARRMANGQKGPTTKLGLNLKSELELDDPAHGRCYGGE